MTLTSRSAAAPETASARPPKPDLPPPLARLAPMIGGTWRGVLKAGGREFVVESTNEWALGGRAIRTRYVFDKGGPLETEGEATVGWDPLQKAGYYLEFHGADQVFQGTADAEGAGVLLEFRSIIGEPAHARARIELTGPDTMQFTRYAQKDGEWVKAFGLEYQRRK